MCGVTGFWSFGKGDFPREKLINIVNKMSAELFTRGPDSFGAWVNPGAQIAIGHRRLAIVDLSDAGHQPMISRSNKFIISYNGEVYNADEIRKDLIKDGILFKGHSDTEVILEACEKWGVGQTLRRLIGMFAFVIWNDDEKVLYLARDRVGIKPLYWGFNKQILFFGSQIKSFFQYPDWQGELDINVLAQYFKYNYIPMNQCILKNFQQVEPGSYIEFGLNRDIKTIKYWILEEVTSHEKITNFSTNEEVIESMENLIADAVKKRMISDVPLGAFLSGGVDSSLVVALMQKQNMHPVKTFTIGFEDKKFNEADHAKLVASHLGTNHNDLYLSTSRAQEIIQDMSLWFDEPFADSSQIPTYLVSKFTKEHVSVCLSGDGGDELFAGYNNYFILNSLWKKMQFFPFSIRVILSEILKIIPISFYKNILKLLGAPISTVKLEKKLRKIYNLIKCKDMKSLYQALLANDAEQEVVLGNDFTNHLFSLQLNDAPLFKNNIEYMQYIDTKMYLPGDILTKVDRASMAVSLEARVPLLDHRIIEFIWQLPFSFKVFNGENKWILRQILYKYVPRHIFLRPKQGFAIPVGDWLRDGLKDWASSHINEYELDSIGCLNSKLILSRWNSHLSGEQDWSEFLWAVVMFINWYSKYKGFFKA